jgi:hypothetical protein
MKSRKQQGVEKRKYKKLALPVKKEKKPANGLLAG